jgi:predicted CopG family antitoxin
MRLVCQNWTDTKLSSRLNISDQRITLVKTITIREEVYRKLLEIKRENESFSRLFDRLVKDRDPLDVLTELRGRVEFKEKKNMISQIYNSRAERRL